MGVLDRYWNSGSAVVRMIMVMSAIWLLTLLIRKPFLDESLYHLLLFNPLPSSFILKPWSLFTYLFLHDNFFHLLFNMLWLYCIGIILEDLIGSKHIYKIIIYGGIFGGLFYMILYQLFSFLQFPGGVSLVGASGGISALIIATAVFTPYYTVMIFGVFPIQLRWIAIIWVLLDLASFSTTNANIGGTITHMGGALFGLLYMLHLKEIFNFPFVDFLTRTLRKKNKPSRKAKVTFNKTYNQKSTFIRNQKPNQDEIDSILDKINRSGYESLTKEEKDTLFRAGE